MSEIKISDLPQAEDQPDIVYATYKPVDVFKRVPEIAERLGVKPVPDGEVGGLYLMRGSETGDTRKWDLFEIFAAFLDRMDAVTRDGPH